MLRFIEMALAAFAVVILTGTHFYWFALGVPAGVTLEELAAYEGQIRNVFLVAYIIVVLLAILNWEKMILGLVAVWPITLLIVLAWLSTFWTVAPELTSRRCIALTITTLMGVYLFTRFDFGELLRFLVMVATIIVLACIAWVFLVPDYGLHNDAAHAGAWRGIFFHKNRTGRVMVFCLAIIIAAWINGGISKSVLTFLGALALLVIVGTTSQATLLGTLVLIGGLIAMRMVRGKALTSALATLVVLAIAWHGALIIATSYEVILEAMGRDASLTGRTDIWAYTLDWAFKRPFTGYGYDAFWNGELSPGAQYAANWDTPHSHNSWIEVLIALGFPGVFLIMGVMLLMMFRAIILARYYPSPAPATFIILIGFSMLTIGMAEPIFLERHTFGWVLLVAAAGCARALMSRLDQVGQEPADLDEPSLASNTRLRRSPT